MLEIPISVVPEGEEYVTYCSCCGRPIYWGHGWLMSERKSLAAFWYQWSEGHQGRFSLAIARFDDEEMVPGVVCMSAQIENESLNYGVCEPDQASWRDFGSFETITSREHALLHNEWLFTLVDAITANDPRLSTRILAASLPLQ